MPNVTMEELAVRCEGDWQPIETAPMWVVADVTDGIQVVTAQKAESDFGDHYWAIDPEDGLDWEPTHWRLSTGMIAPARALTPRTDGGEER